MSGAVKYHSMDEKPSTDRNVLAWHKAHKFWEVMYHSRSWHCADHDPDCEAEDYSCWINIEVEPPPAEWRGEAHKYEGETDAC